MLGEDLVGGGGGGAMRMRMDGFSSGAMVVHCPFDGGRLTLWSGWEEVWELTDEGERTVWMAARIRDLVYVKEGEDGVTILLWNRQA